MSKLYVALVGLPASGKSTLAKRIRDDFVDEGINCAIFNNGELRRKIAGPASTESSWYAPDNSEGREIRERIALANMQEAKKFLSEGGDVAVLDATNGSRKRRRLLEETLNDHPLLFIECLNEDPVLHEACIRRKALLPEYASYSEEDAVESFKARIAYYNSIYEHLDEEKYYLCVDTMANREGRIGGDPLLSEKGRMQAAQLAEHMKDTRIDYIFTSTRRRSGETAAFLAKTRPDVRIYALPEFDELNAGVCRRVREHALRGNTRNNARGNQGPQCGQVQFLLPRGRELRHGHAARLARTAQGPLPLCRGAHLHRGPSGHQPRSSFHVHAPAHRGHSLHVRAAKPVLPHRMHTACAAGQTHPVSGKEGVGKAAEAADKYKRGTVEQSVQPSLLRSSMGQDS